MSKWAHEKVFVNKSIPQEQHLYCVCYEIGCYGYKAKNEVGSEYMSMAEAKKLASTIRGAEIHRAGS